MPDLRFAESAWRDYLEWNQLDKATAKKINKLIAEILRTPYEGTGKPEPLKHDLAGLWSRRINGADRLVYQVTQDGVRIVACKGHYE